jgi:hypothetical protein
VYAQSRLLEKLSVKLKAMAMVTVTKLAKVTAMV